MRLKDVLSALRTSLQAFKEPGAGRRLFATLVTFPVLLVVMGDWLTAITGQALVTFVALNLHRATQRHLQARIDASDRQQWDVLVNGVHVGSMHDAQYAATMARAYGSTSTWTAQAHCLARAHLRAISLAFTLAPALIVWGTVLAIFFAPAELAHALSQFQRQLVDPSFPLTTLILDFFKLLITATVLSIGLGPRRFGITNCFSGAVDFELRRWFSVAADGHVTVVPMTAHAQAHGA